jgi:putative spermidine/putrescine transport system substrate-binding protein
MSGLHILALARHAGGDEKNVEPGWALLKEIAKAGNIGRVAQTEVEFINSVSSGETSVSFWHLSAWNSVAKNAPVVHLTKKAGFTTYLTTTGWVVLPTSKNKEATQRFLNFCLEPENLALYSKTVGEVPANFNVPVDASMEQLKFTAEESAQFTNLPDWEFLSTQVGEWTKRWETEIAPLL